MKHLYPKGYKAQDPAQLITKTCEIMRHWHENGHWQGFCHSVEEPLSSLIRSPVRLQSERMHIENFEEDAERDVDLVSEAQYSQRRRLNVHLMQSWYAEKGAEATFLHRSLEQHPFVVNFVEVYAIDIWVFPKYDLHMAVEKQGDMQRAMALSLSLSEADVVDALGCESYSFSTHRYS